MDSNLNSTPAPKIVIKPIVYGSIAFWLGKRSEELVSHKWCIYVRGENNEDISYYVKEVHFTLHQSFDENCRIIKKWPFVLFEKGWGEFDIKINIYFVDETLKTVEFNHSLKLYPSLVHVAQSTKKPIVSESYDEVIFVNPKPWFYDILTNPQNNVIKDHVMEDSVKDNNERDNANDDKMMIDEHFKSNKVKSEPSIVNSTNENVQVNSSLIKISSQVLDHREEPTSPRNNDMDIDKYDNMSMDHQAYGRLNSNYIPNLPLYFLPVDDLPHYKAIEDALSFVNREINKIKNNIDSIDYDIKNVKGNIRDLDHRK